MKWVKTAIGAVIAVMSIGIIAISVYKMTLPSEVIREVSFEIDYDEEEYYPRSIFYEILEYGVINVDNEVINIVSGYVDNYEINNFSVFRDSHYYYIRFVGFITTPDGDITIDSTLWNAGYWYNNGEIDDDVNIKIVFEVSQPSQITGNIATLILLIPLVFAGGVLYFYKPFKKD